MKEVVDKLMDRESTLPSDSTKIETVEYIHVLRELDKDVQLAQPPILLTKHRAQSIRDSQWRLWWSILCLSVFRMSQQKNNEKSKMCLLIPVMQLLKTLAQRLFLIKSFTKFANFATRILRKTTFGTSTPPICIEMRRLFDATQYPLKKNGSETQSEKLKSYLAPQKWEGIIEHGPKAMSLDKMTAVLGDIDIDKSLITIIPDIQFTRSVQTYLPFCSYKRCLIIN